MHAESRRVCPCVSRTKSEIDAVLVLILNKTHNFLKQNGSRVSVWMFERSQGGRMRDRKVAENLPLALACLTLGLISESSYDIFDLFFNI